MKTTLVALVISGVVLGCSTISMLPNGEVYEANTIQVQVTEKQALQNAASEFVKTVYGQ